VIERELAARGWLGFERLLSPSVDLVTLQAVHPSGYVAAIERACRDGTRHLDMDTVISTLSWEVALHGSGGAVRLVELLLEGSAPTGFSAHRPPGHHAERARAGGFCIFNHVAVAAQHALDCYGLDRVLILDWDVHHGNGTNDIFHASRNVLYVSIHQSPLWPGTGPANDWGSEDAPGFTVNLPVPPGADDDVFRSLVDHVVVPLAVSFKPQLVLVSAGYDAHREDPLADCLVTEGGFAAMAGSVVRVCAELGTPLGVVLEGGYALGPLARSVAATLEVLAGADTSLPSGSPAPTAEPEVNPLVSAARERLKRWWPVFS
jgi:acetoin utilization deacetylase AcuC-like enzyme